MKTKKIIIISIIILIIDQISKIIISTFIPLNNSLNVIKNFFKLTYVNNEGAAFSILTNQRILLIMISFLALAFIIKNLKEFKVNPRNNIAFGLLIGGICGNLIDRLFLGYVRDFLDFKIFNYNFPVFNISDSAIFIGVVLIIIAIIKGEDHGSKSYK
jgi:signal peptidase II